MLEQVVHQIARAERPFTHVPATDHGRFVHDEERSGILVSSYAHARITVIFPCRAVDTPVYGGRRLPCIRRQHLRCTSGGREQDHRSPFGPQHFHQSPYERCFPRTRIAFQDERGVFLGGREQPLQRLRGAQLSRCGFMAQGLEQSLAEFVAGKCDGNAPDHWMSHAPG